MDPEPILNYPLEDAEIQVDGHTWLLSAVGLNQLLRTVSPGTGVSDFPHGLLLWPTAIALAAWMAERPELVAGKRLLELGSGVGLPGMAAQRLGAAVSQTDYLPDALALTRINAHQNAMDGITYFQADWRAFPRDARYDVVLGSDVLYVRDLRLELAALLQDIVVPGGLILFADRIPEQIDYFVRLLQSGPWQIHTEVLELNWEGEIREPKLLVARHNPPVPG